MHIQAAIEKVHYIFPLVKEHSCQNEMLNQKTRLETLKLITSTDRKPYPELLIWNHDSYSHWYHANFYQQKRADFIVMIIFYVCY